MPNVEETVEYCNLGHEDCQYCPRPCQLCSRTCFQGRCYECFPERVIPCRFCGERMWDGICDCEEEDEEKDEEVNSN